MRSTLALWVTLLTTSGCYSYRPTTLETVPVGTEIRGLLSTEARITLEDSLRLQLSTLHGTLVERNGDSLLVTVRSVAAGSTTEGRPLYQRIALAQGDVLRVDVKRLDKPRTIALVAAVATFAIAAVIEGFWSDPGEPPCCGPPPPEAPPVWAIRIPLPR